MKLSSGIFKRNGAKIKKLIVEKNGVMTSGEDGMKVYFPQRFMDKELVFIEQNVKVLGVLIICDSEYNYSLVNIPNFISMSPNSISTVSIDGIEYMELTFNKGSEILTTNKLVMNDDFVFTVLDEFVINGRIPFYIEYEDLLKFFLKSRKMAGSNIADNHRGISILISIISRSKKDTSLYIRQVIKDKKEIKNSLVYIGLSNVLKAYNNTLSKITGSYLKKGILSSINHPEKEGGELNEIYDS